MKWEEILSPEVEKQYFKDLALFIRIRSKVASVFPSKENLFKSFELTSFDNIKVVILGQDPYHGLNQATGLAFAVDEKTIPPPSLINIFKEVRDDVGNREDLRKTNLEDWAKQGVLLLNTILTVEENKPGSHANKDWENFTSYIIEEISSKKQNVVFFLWGNFAKSRKQYIDTTKHLVLESVHSSPLSSHRGFFGCKHFSKANEYLKQNNIKTINW